MNVVLLLLLILAAFRITRLITRDTIFDAWRDKVPEDRWYGELIRCDWCTGVWVAALVVGVCNLFIDFQVPVFVWAAVAGGLGLLASWER